ncbi:hypothetical protein EDB82DRAFT_498298 [Fusarium venenatum]|uniref:uncharacterized protein n=1 Tax=Fusarium venenatum TaxID=56646 RepID=UPI001E080BF5|nr:hypothetical protein EDB82DRAFT_498298 [Fusarium venenatum]
MKLSTAATVIVLEASVSIAQGYTLLCIYVTLIHLLTITLQLNINLFNSRMSYRQTMACYYRRKKEGIYHVITKYRSASCTANSLITLD